MLVYLIKILRMVTTACRSRGILPKPSRGPSGSLSGRLPWSYEEFDFRLLCRRRRVFYRYRPAAGIITFSRRRDEHYPDASAYAT